jgi:hypothetical protein
MPLSGGGVITFVADRKHKYLSSALNTTLSKISSTLTGIHPHDQLQEILLRVSNVAIEMLGV